MYDQMQDKTKEDYRAMVAEARQAGADFIKVMISGLVDFDHFGVITSEPLTAQQIRELITIAHGEGFSVMAHANGAQTVLAAVEAGVDSVEHGAVEQADFQHDRREQTHQQHTCQQTAKGACRHCFCQTFFI